MKNKVKQLTIDESKWTTGTLYYDGSYCALGHLCKALGAKDEEMEGFSVPEELDEYPKWMDKKLTKKQKESIFDDDDDCEAKLSFQTAIWETNDSPMPREEKKNTLKQIFKFVGIDLHFKNSDNSIMK